MATLEEKTEKSVDSPQEESMPNSSAITDSQNNSPIAIAFEHKPSGVPATRKELWAYYAYFAGNNGIGSFQ